jgi:hypothetical protein
MAQQAPRIHSLQAVDVTVALGRAQRCGPAGGCVHHHHREAGEWIRSESAVLEPPADALEKGNLWLLYHSEGPFNARHHVEFGAQFGSPGIAAREEQNDEAQDGTGGEPEHQEGDGQSGPGYDVVEQRRHVHLGDLSGERAEPHVAGHHQRGPDGPFGQAAHGNRLDRHDRRQEVCPATPGRLLFSRLWLLAAAKPALWTRPRGQDSAVVDIRVVLAPEVLPSVAIPWSRLGHNQVPVPGPTDRRWTRRRTFFDHSSPPSGRGAMYALAS